MHTTASTPSTPHATAWQGGMAGAQAGRGEMHPVFPSCSPSPLSPLFPLFSFSPWFLGAFSTTLLPAPASSLLVPFPCLVFPQFCCSVCHCLIVILTTHPHDVLLPPLSPFPLPTHQQAAFGCEASPTWIAGMLAAAPEEDPVTKEHTTLSSNTFPFLMSVRTRRCSCRALP